MNYSVVLLGWSACARSTRGFQNRRIYIKKSKVFRKEKLEPSQ
jgi:hypothetical protein